MILSLVRPLVAKANRYCSCHPHRARPPPATTPVDPPTRSPARLSLAILGERVRLGSPLFVAGDATLNGSRTDEADAFHPIGRRSSGVRISGKEGRHVVRMRQDGPGGVGVYATRATWPRPPPTRSTPGPPE